MTRHHNGRSSHRPHRQRRAPRGVVVSPNDLEAGVTSSVPPMGNPQFVHVGQPPLANGMAPSPSPSEVIPGKKKKRARRFVGKKGLLDEVKKQSSLAKQEDVDYSKMSDFEIQHAIAEAKTAGYLLCSRFSGRHQLLQDSSPLSNPEELKFFTDAARDGCCICICPLELPVMLPCAHTFCEGCLSGWFSTDSNSTCPICRRELWAGRRFYERREAEEVATMQQNYADGNETSNTKAVLVMAAVLAVCICQNALCWIFLSATGVI